MAGQAVPSSPVDDKLPLPLGRRMRARRTWLGGTTGVCHEPTGDRSSLRSQSSARAHFQQRRRGALLAKRGVVLGVGGRFSLTFDHISTGCRRRSAGDAT
jgi:hypothetical protein